LEVVHGKQKIDINVARGRCYGMEFVMAKIKKKYPVKAKQQCSKMDNSAKEQHKQIATLGIYN